MLLRVGRATAGGNWKRPTSSGGGASSGGSDDGVTEGANNLKLGGRRPTSKGGGREGAASSARVQTEEGAASVVKGASVLHSHTLCTGWVW